MFTKLSYFTLDDIDYNIFRLMIEKAVKENIRNILYDYFVSFSKFINNEQSRYESMYLQLILHEKTKSIEQLFTCISKDYKYVFTFSEMMNCLEIRSKFRDDTRDVIMKNNEISETRFSLLFGLICIDKLYLLTNRQYSLKKTRRPNRTYIKEYQEFNKFNYERLKIQLYKSEFHHIENNRSDIIIEFSQRVYKIKRFIRVFKDILSSQFKYEFLSKSCESSCEKLQDSDIKKYFENNTLRNAYKDSITNAYTKSQECSIIVSKITQRNQLINELTSVLKKKCDEDILFENVMKKLINHKKTKHENERDTIKKLNIIFQLLNIDYYDKQIIYDNLSEYVSISEYVFNIESLDALLE